jgi:hypothetical protein
VTIPEDVAIAATRRWLEQAVIGLNLCPYARAPYFDDRIRYVVSSATTPEALLQALAGELQWLAAADEHEAETTLLIHPQVLQDFFEYNDFLELGDALLEDLGLSGTLQVASFHPQYQFSGADADDVSNCTNRSPYPMLHLLRESSITRAVDGHPDTTKIYEANIDTLRRLGRAGWERLGVGAPDED